MSRRPLAKVCCLRVDVAGYKRVVFVVIAAPSCVSSLFSLSSSTVGLVVFALVVAIVLAVVVFVACIVVVTGLSLHFVVS